MLGDVHIAEPGALICFAGPRVIQQTIREQLPEGFQKAEYLLAHGMIDMVVHRHQLRETLARLCRLLTANAAVARPAKPIAAKRRARLSQRQRGRRQDHRDAGALLRDVMEPSPSSDDERFEARDETDAATPDPSPRPKPRGALQPIALRSRPARANAAGRPRHRQWLCDPRVG